MLVFNRQLIQGTISFTGRIKRPPIRNFTFASRALYTERNRSRTILVSSRAQVEKTDAAVGKVGKPRHRYRMRQLRDILSWPGPQSAIRSRSHIRAKGRNTCAATWNSFDTAASEAGAFPYCCFLRAASNRSDVNRVLPATNRTTSWLLLSLPHSENGWLCGEFGKILVFEGATVSKMTV